MAQREFNWPINPTTVNSGPLQFEVDGIPTIVNVDTGTPANSTPLPVTNLNPDGTPVDYATSANQVLQIAQETATATNVASINTKTPALVGGSVPVVGPLTDTQLRATPVPVSGPLTDTQLRANPVPVSGTVTSNQGTAGATPWPVAVSNFPATQPVSGTVVANQGAAGASAWKVDGSAVTQPISATALPLPNGAATEATLAAMSAKLPATIGQKTSATSLAVVLASDQAAIPSPKNANATVGAATTVGTSAITETAPADAVSFTLYAPVANTGTIYFIQGAVATAANGFETQPGRSWENMQCSANISLIADSAGQGYRLQWNRR